MGTRRRSLFAQAVFLAVVLTPSLLNSGCTGAGVTVEEPNAELTSAPWTIKAENAKPGTTRWQLTNAARGREIEGFASATSVNRGEDISIFVNTTDRVYLMEFFRLGWYGGQGGREVQPAVVLEGIKQAMPLPDPETHLLECQWHDPYVLHIPNSSDPTEWASGVYLVKLTGVQSGKQSYVIFLVRDDERVSDLLYQSSVTTFAAYNNWGGWSLYTHPRAYMVSFNRPYARDFGAGDFFRWEYNMVRFLEREGYDVTYATNIDTHARGRLLMSHKGFLSVGHDEYWSWEMRNNVEAARDSGIGLGFFGADASYWQIRLQPSALSTASNRTIVCYKSVLLDPLATDQNPDNQRRTTTLFRDPPVNRPEDSMVGIMFESTFAQNYDVVVTDATSWVFENTGLRDGDHLPGLLGDENDRLFGNAPPSTAVIAHSIYQDVFGQNRYADIATYTAPSGGTVFATGSMRWNWGLDDFTTRWHAVLTNAAAQQATRNVLRKLGATDPASISPPSDSDWGANQSPK
ncbi:MAG TPA: N,N-dimethylformamidase beta subunit family domain-containing protein [Candidatus Acidoferrum sp.]|nr:N,N-dimethylformamidase beta subunit family domain-containing protein [Candidatus Acidoferrum sp.]